MGNEKALNMTVMNQEIKHIALDQAKTTTATTTTEETDAEVYLIKEAMKIRKIKEAMKSRNGLVKGYETKGNNWTNDEGNNKTDTPDKENMKSERLNKTLVSNEIKEIALAHQTGRTK